MAGKEKSRGELLTEQQNPSTKDIDSKTVTEILELINREDQAVAEKVAAAIPDISKAVELTTAAIRNGHCVFYIGAGTSGRLGVLDASEMPPTFSTPPNWFNGIIAGGDDALRKSIEGAEDQPENANKDLQAWGLEKGDVVIGISTSGAAAYVQRAIDYGREQGCGTCYILCTPVPYYEADADVVIKVESDCIIAKAARKMRDNKVGALMVMKNDTLSGIFTERDLMSRVVAEGLDPEKVKVAEAMTSSIATVPLETPIREAANIMSQNRIRHLPVLEEGQLYGVISVGDILAWKLREQEFTLHQLEDYFFKS